MPVGALSHSLSENGSYSDARRNEMSFKRNETLKGNPVSQRELSARARERCFLIIITAAPSVRRSTLELTRSVRIVSGLSTSRMSRQ